MKEISILSQLDAHLLFWLLSNGICLQANYSRNGRKKLLKIVVEFCGI